MERKILLTGAYNSINPQAWHMCGYAVTPACPVGTKLGLCFVPWLWTRTNPIKYFDLSSTAWHLGHFFSSAIGFLRSCNRAANLNPIGVGCAPDGSGSVLVPRRKVDDPKAGFGLEELDPNLRLPSVRWAKMDDAEGELGVRVLIGQLDFLPGLYRLSHH
jgi:hypothetical protein